MTVKGVRKKIAISDQVSAFFERRSEEGKR